MRYVVIILPEAEERIAEALAYIQRHSPHNAQRWVRGIYEAIMSLEDMLRRCAPARESDGWPGELRQLVFKSHRIIFEVEDQTVYVLTVRHTGQDVIDPHDR